MKNVWFTAMSHLFLSLIASMVLANDNALQESLIQNDNRFHILRERYPTLKANDLHMYAATADGSTSLWRGKDSSNKDCPYLHLILTPHKSTDMIQRTEGFDFYDQVELSATFLHAIPHWGDKLQLHYLHGGQWQRTKPYLYDHLSQFCLSKDANEIFLAYPHGEIQSYNINSWQKKIHCQFNLTDFIRRMVLVKNCLIAKTTLGGIYQLNLETESTKKILSKFHGDELIVSADESYLMVYFNEGYQDKKRRKQAESKNEKWQPRPKCLKIFNLNVLAAKGKPTLEWEIFEKAGKIELYQFLPHQSDLFLVSHELHGCMLYSLKQKSKIAKIVTYERIFNFLFPSPEEIVLKFQITDAVNINLKNVLANYNAQPDEGGIKKEITARREKSCTALHWYHLINNTY